MLQQVGFHGVQIICLVSPTGSVFFDGCDALRYLRDISLTGCQIAPQFYSRFFILVRSDEELDASDVDVMTRFFLALLKTGLYDVSEVEELRVWGKLT